MLQVPPRTDPSAAWFQLYQAAIIELDYTKLPERIAEARLAIYGAEETLTYSSSFLPEHRSLNNALRTLLILEEVAQREKNSA